MAREDLPAPAPGSGKGKLIATLGISAAALVTTIVGSWEGKSNDPYRDIIGKLTVCTGETNVAMRHYSDAECADMLANSLAGYGKSVLERNPTLKGHPYQLAAAVSLEYNIGPANYWRSTVARKFSAGDWKGACDAFLQWRFAGHKEIPGLLNRRKAERQTCLTGLN